MKKIISLILILTLCASAFTACGSETQAPSEPQNTTSDIVAAKEYLFSMYRQAPSTHVEDFKVVGKLVVGDNQYDVEWTADSDTVNFVKGDDNMVTVDINEQNPEEVNFKLTATITDANGNKESVSFDKRVPAAIILDNVSYEEIVEAAYKLEDGMELGEEHRLFGKIVKIDSPFNDKYNNITVTIQVGDLADKTIQCFRMVGDGVATLKEGDEITVNGIIKNYKGTVEFDKGCQLIGLGEHKDQSGIVEAAYKLEDGIAMKEEQTLTGVITVAGEYNEKYKNTTVTIVVDDMKDMPIECFRLKGEGVETLKEGDTITVTGILKNYKGKIEFDAGCTLDAKA